MRYSRSERKIETTVMIHGGGLIYPPGIIDRITALVLAHEGKEITVVYDATDSRSKKQNAFFHAVIVPAMMRLLREIGEDRWRDREWVKEVVLKKPFLTMNSGTGDEYIRHTSELNTAEMWRFMNQCLIMFADMGGSLNPWEQERYAEIVERYNLGPAIDEAIEKNA